MTHFNLSCPKPNGEEALEISLALGNILFVLGANGTGKSAFLTHINTKFTHVKRILAHRQLALEDNGIDLRSTHMNNYKINIDQFNRTPEARCSPRYLREVPQMILSDLISINNQYNQSIIEAIKAGEVVENILSPLDKLNNLLQLSNLEISITTDLNKFYASKNSSPRYSIVNLSDAEKSALSLISEVLTVPPNTLILIDEPERHFHRSIISPLITQLLQERDDCAFVVATHDINLPMDNPNANVLLIRSCEWKNEGNSCFWDADLLESKDEIDDKLKQDILGSRRNLLFVEGETQSLDYQLYKILFPDVSVIPKGDCRNVQAAVKSLRENESVHWVKAYGIIDADDHDESDLESLKNDYIYALPCYAIESIYFSPEVLEEMANRVASHKDVCREELLENTQKAILDKMGQRKEHLCSYLCERIIRKQIKDPERPKRDQILGKGTFKPYEGLEFQQEIDLDAFLETEMGIFESLLTQTDTQTLIFRYPVKKSGVMGAVAKALEFRNTEDYMAGFRKMMMDNNEFRNKFIELHFSELSREIQATETMV